jgi:hypothetical protein
MRAANPVVRPRQSPLIIEWLPGGFQIGFIHHFT